MKRCGLLLALALLAAATWACYESPDIAVHTPGIYKGTVDPLLAEQRSPEALKVLRERFAQIQTDR
jgi:hypothetical protein